MKDFRARESVTVSPGQYVYKVIPSNPGLSCITSANELVCLDATTLKVVLRLSGETLPTSLSCLQASLDDSMLHCAGGDGVVASFDPRAGGRVNAFKADRAVTALACGAPGIAVGTELANHQAVVSVWDQRTSTQQWQNAENNDDIVDLQYHPSRFNHLLSGGVDGLVSIFDTSVSDEEDSLLQAINHSPIHSAGFVSDDVLYALSTDEQLAIHPVTTQLNAEDVSESKVLADMGNLRPLLACDYVIDVIRSADGSANVVAGSHTDKQQIDLVPLNTDYTFELGEIITLVGAHGEEVVRSIWVDEKRQTIFTAGEDGCVKAFGAEEVRKMAQQAEKKGKKHVKKETSARFNPY